MAYNPTHMVRVWTNDREIDSSHLVVGINVLLYYSTRYHYHVSSFVCPMVYKLQYNCSTMVLTFEQFIDFCMSLFL